MIEFYCLLMRFYAIRDDDDVGAVDDSLMHE